MVEIRIAAADKQLKAMWQSRRWRTLENADCPVPQA
jgi:hypothetical protein